MKRVIKWISDMFNGRIGRMPTKTIDEIIATLNSFEARTGGTGIWSPVDGVQAIMAVTRSTSITGGLSGSFGDAISKPVNFHPDSGVLLKAFVNSVTGEIRLFPAKMFGYPEQNI